MSISCCPPPNKTHRSIKGFTTKRRLRFFASPLLSFSPPWGQHGIPLFQLQSTFSFMLITMNTLLPPKYSRWKLLAVPEPQLGPNTPDFTSSTRGIPVLAEALLIHSLSLGDLWPAASLSLSDSDCSFISKIGRQFLIVEPYIVMLLMPLFVLNGIMNGWANQECRHNGQWRSFAGCQPARRVDFFQGENRFN